ncbi:exopolysaccharide biosynthesis polyprenyl glycosylphosphotransferase [Polaribacter septentrionalilitoris]|uniref:exopolysaccharide biosynthesis polyprenyl glycosylphosphotransferase n=1 Tax=Polaribacter septentrionalilitoris TaxID=2494657 RepID=UPI00135973E5|nr:exopolysaccharide biosynthesis polyprenyl glycosylphosphotransferase [Polaribacter septentrionalilitoris]
MASKKTYLDISERKFFLRLFDVLILILSIWFSYVFLDFKYFKFNNQLILNWFILLIFYYVLFGEIFQLYNLSVSNNRYLILRSVVLTAFATTIFYVFTPYISPVLPENRLQIVYFFLIISTPIIIWRFIYSWLIFSPKYFKTILFIGHSSLVKKLLTHIKNDNFHHVTGYVSEQKIDGLKGYHDINSFDLSYLVENNPITEVVVSEKNLTNDNVSFLNQELIANFKKGVNIISYETFYETVTSRVPKEYLDHTFYKNLNFSKNNSNRFYLFGLRFIDIVISILGLLVFTFLIPILLICNFIGNRGALFYTQERVGQNTKPFTIYKLRSMVKNAESNGAVWAAKNDVRITVFGKFLRNTRLDEIPQFFNILKGDMSLIGPRPERPEFVKDLEKEIPFYSIRHVVRPGLTGWAQVNYPYANSIEEQETKLRYDLYYIKERDTLLDFKILIKTITTVLFFKGQ